MTDLPHEVDCFAVVQELYTFLDGELTEHKRMQITQHLIACVDCHEVVDFYAELKMTISSRCRETVPERLRQRIIDSLGQGGVGWDRNPGIPRI